MTSAVPSPAAVADRLAPGDVRVADVPGIVGGPVEVLVLVIALGVATALVTAVIVRVRRTDERSR